MSEHWYRYAIVPKGIHVIIAASKSGYEGMYLCKMLGSGGDYLKTYHMLINKNNIYKSVKAAKRKQFKDQLRGFTKAE